MARIATGCSCIVLERAPIETRSGHGFSFTPMATGSPERFRAAAAFYPRTILVFILDLRTPAAMTTSTYGGLEEHGSDSAAARSTESLFLKKGQVCRLLHQASRRNLKALANHRTGSNEPAPSSYHF